ncbi:unnamed protein product [Cylicostephanus goldi]|uniref:Uncharacterized protein n=1 Tax=Cylicostephanus goldi TaxID=71465 RepID=A0A3P6R8Q1_CYLGO|nr:unnamed protein product [Cylicostephanus goldi]
MRCCRRAGQHEVLERCADALQDVIDLVPSNLGSFSRRQEMQTTGSGPKPKPIQFKTIFKNVFSVAFTVVALKALTQLLIENMTLTKFFGLAEVDSLLSEFILDDINDQSAAPVSLQAHLSSPITLPSSIASQVVTSVN